MEGNGPKLDIIITEGKVGNGESVASKKGLI